MKSIVAKEGLGGLFAGVQARVLMSALFGGVGFASFEACKRHLGVVTPIIETP
jgi:Mitochondrial carrier protein